MPFAAMPGTASSLKFPVVKDLLASSKEVSLMWMFSDVCPPFFETNMCFHVVTVDGQTPAPFLDG